MSSATELLAELVREMRALRMALVPNNASSAFTAGTRTPITNDGVEKLLLDTTINDDPDGPAPMVRISVGITEPPSTSETDGLDWPITLRVAASVGNSRDVFNVDVRRGVAFRIPAHRIELFASMPTTASAGTVALMAGVSRDNGAPTLPSTYTERAPAVPGPITDGLVYQGRIPNRAGELILQPTANADVAGLVTKFQVGSGSGVASQSLMRVSGSGALPVGGGGLIIPGGGRWLRIETSAGSTSLISLTWKLSL